VVREGVMQGRSKNGSVLRVILGARRGEKRAGY
jgi:hypothetical protein